MGLGGVVEQRGGREGVKLLKLDRYKLIKMAPRNNSAKFDSVLRGGITKVVTQKLFHSVNKSKERGMQRKIVSRAFCSCTRAQNVEE